MPFKIGFRTQVANALFENGKSDLVEILELIKIKKFIPSETILPEEEKFKLTLFKIPPANTNREELEQIFWNVEDHKFNNGSISFLLLCLGLQALDINDKIKKFSLQDFKNYKTIFDELFNAPSDLRIRALLTKGDYTFKDGSNPTLEGERWSFCYSESDLRFIVSEKARSEKLKELILSIHQIGNNQSIEKKLDQIIQAYLKDNNNATNWYFDFVHLGLSCCGH